MANFNGVWLAAEAAPRGPAATKPGVGGWGQHDPITFATAISPD
jgi:hypothetical protein